jgi:hypothetical protein
MLRRTADVESYSHQMSANATADPPIKTADITATTAATTTDRAARRLSPLRMLQLLSTIACAAYRDSEDAAT